TITKSHKSEIADYLSQIISSESHLIPSYNSLTRNVQRTRQGINLPITLTFDTTQLIITEQYKINLINKNYPFYEGVKNNGERLSIFRTPRQSVCEIFFQLFVFHGEYKNVLIPCVFELIEG
ncbi:hypothetical protein HZS_5649, partial [Henneguya salminicola]